ncbi:hypothetical protein T439DRAFT_345718 [Meredithblackwellia eburnea MCA 4105]
MSQQQRGKAPPQQQQQQQQQKQTLSFPSLETDEIIEQCKSISLVLAPDDLNHPTAAKARQIYAYWLNYIVRISIDDINNSVQEKLDSIPNSEMYRESLFYGTFQITMDQLMLRCDVNDFSYTDLTAPTSDRLKGHVSALINFYLFEREQALEYLEDLLHEIEGFQARADELAVENETLEERYHLESETRSQSKPQIEQLKAKTLDLKNKLQAQTDEVSGYTKQVENNIADMKKLSNDIADIKTMISNNELELNRLKSQHVQSPDRMRANISELKNTVATEQESVRKLEQTERMLQTKVSSLLKYEQNLGSVLKLLDEWEVDVQKLQQNNSRYQAHQDEFDALQAEKTELANQTQIIKQKLANALDELARINEKSDRKRAASRQKSKVLEEHYSKLLEQKGAIEMDATAKNREAANVENEIRSLRETMHMELELGETEFKKIKDQVTLYSIRLNKALDSINLINSQPLDLSR